MSFKSNKIILESKDLSKFGKEFQVKLIALLIKDRTFAFSIIPIIKDIYFSDVYLRVIFICIKEYFEEHNSLPTIDNIKISINLIGEKVSVYEKILETIDTVGLEDRDFVIKNSRSFCFTKHALSQNDLMLNHLKAGEIEKAKRISIESFQHSGLETAKILDLKKDIEKAKNTQILRKPIPVMFQTFNDNSKGGISDGEITIVIAPSNFGKCVLRGTKIRMADFSVKKVEDIVVGDEVMGVDGKPRKVVDLTNGYDEMYEVRQKNGINYTVNSQHTLRLKRKKHRRVDFKNNSEFVEIEVKDYVQKSKNWKSGVTGYKASQEFEEKDLKVEPYYLGLWLGDVTNEQSNGINNKNILYQNLKSYNLIDNKHIPIEYMTSSRQQRLELLAGLLDSDGYLEKVTKTCFEISQVRKELSWQIYVLASGLGFKCNFLDDVGKDKMYSSVTIMGDTYLIPTKIECKKAAIRNNEYDSTTSEIEVIPVGYNQYFGFQISEEEIDSLFMLEDFTVLHNCFIKGTKIRMADTTLKRVEEVVVGDEIMGYDGIKRTVGHVTTGSEEMFKISQRNGQSYTVNKSHILSLKKQDEFVNIEVGDYLKKDDEWKKDAFGYKSALNFNDENININPYFLGLWLSNCNNEETEPEIYNFVQTYARENGISDEKIRSTIKNKPFGVSLFFENGINELGKKAKEIDIIKNRLIPHNYLFSSRETRLQLLAGFIDFCGVLEPVSKITFDVIHNRSDVAWQIYILASGLGFKTIYQKRLKDYKVTINGETDIIPTLLEKNKAVKRKKKFDASISEITVESKGIGEYYGFSVIDEDKRFLLEDFTVVHNSQWLVAQARHINFMGKNVAFFSYEMESEPLMEKYMAGLLDVSQNNVFHNHFDEIKERLNDNKLGDLRIITDRAANATLANIESQIEYLKSTGFFPHAIIIDGLNQIKLPAGVRAKDDNEKFEIITEDVKDLCKKLKVPGFMVWQTNRTGFGTTLNGIESIGKAIEIFQKADQVITFAQTLVMKENNECVAFLIKNRLGKKEIALICHYDPEKVIFLEKSIANPNILLNDAEKEKVKKTTGKIRDKIKAGEFLPKKD